MEHKGRCQGSSGSDSGRIEEIGGTMDAIQKAIKAYNESLLKDFDRYCRNRLKKEYYKRHIEEIIFACKKKNCIQKIKKKIMRKAYGAMICEECEEVEECRKHSKNRRRK